MEWEAWCEAYPAREVSATELVGCDGPYVTRKQAEDQKEWFEVSYERGGFEVVTCEDLFWVLG